MTKLERLKQHLQWMIGEISAHHLDTLNTQSLVMVDVQVGANAGLKCCTKTHFGSQCREKEYSLFPSVQCFQVRQYPDMHLHGTYAVIAGNCCVSRDWLKEGHCSPESGYTRSLHCIAGERYAVGSNSGWVAGSVAGILRPGGVALHVVVVVRTETAGNWMGIQ